MSTRNLELGRPIPVRLPAALAADIKEESQETGVAESVIIRRDLMAARRDRASSRKGGLREVRKEYEKTIEDTSDGA